jgi:hypothetical protein
MASCDAIRMVTIIKPNIKKMDRLVYSDYCLFPGKDKGEDFFFFQ